MSMEEALQRYFVEVHILEVEREGKKLFLLAASRLSGLLSIFFPVATD